MDVRAPRDPHTAPRGAAARRRRAAAQHGAGGGGGDASRVEGARGAEGGAGEVAPLWVANLQSRGGCGEDNGTAVGGIPLPYYFTA